MSAGFTHEPEIVWEKGKYLAQLREDLIFEDERKGRDGRPLLYVVPNRFYTDFASIPRFLWGLSSPVDPGNRLPSILHDYLYSLRGGDPYGLNRKACDDIFLRALALEGQAAWKRALIYRVVRLFGGIHSRGVPWTQ